MIPVEIRKRLGISERDPVEISVKGETIMLAKAQTVCLFCGRDEDLAEFRGRLLCRPCIGELAQAETASPAVQSEPR